MGVEDNILINKVITDEIYFDMCQIIFRADIHSAHDNI